MNVDQFLGELARLDAPEEIQPLIVGLRDGFGIDHMVYHWVSSDGEQYGFGTYDPSWVRRYVEKDYLRVDPVVRSCFQRFHPVDWRDLDWSGKAVRTFREDAMASGVGNQGYTIPMRGPGGQFALFTLSHEGDDAFWDAFTTANQRDLIVVAHFINQKALEMQQHRVPPPAKALSPREVDTLTYLSMGYSRGQVADMLSISEHTLRAYIESARHKLGALNTTHAVARAASEGLIVVGGASRGAAGGWPGKDEAEEADAMPEETARA